MIDGEDTEYAGGLMRREAMRQEEARESRDSDSDGQQLYFFVSTTCRYNVRT